MLNRKTVVCAAIGVLSACPAFAQSETVYAPPTPVTAEEGTNQGGIHFDLNVRYRTDHVYRGVDYTEVTDEDERAGGEDNLNLTADTTIRFDLGPRRPHPFIGMSANVYDSDPESRFQEFRPVVGADLYLQPITFTAGHQTYIYPERETIETNEFFAKVQLDDSRMLGRERPLLSPYVLVAYDYDLNDGIYAEAGVSHDIIFEDSALTITPVARIAYTRGWQQQFTFVVEEGTGFQHMDLGVEGRYRVNSLLNMSRRWGEWFLTGQIYYTEHLSEDTVGHTELWGGVGIGLQY